MAREYIVDFTDLKGTGKDLWTIWSEYIWSFGWKGTIIWKGSTPTLTHEEINELMTLLPFIQIQITDY